MFTLFNKTYSKMNALLFNAGLNVANAGDILQDQADQQRAMVNALDGDAVNVGGNGDDAGIDAFVHGRLSESAAARLGKLPENSLVAVTEGVAHYRITLPGSDIPDLKRDITATSLSPKLFLPYGTFSPHRGILRKFLEREYEKTNLAMVPHLKGRIIDRLLDNTSTAPAILLHAGQIPGYRHVALRLPLDGPKRHGNCKTYQMLAVTTDGRLECGDIRFEKPPISLGDAFQAMVEQNYDHIKIQSDIQLNQRGKGFGAITFGHRLSVKDIAQAALGDDFNIFKEFGLIDGFRSLQSSAESFTHNLARKERRRELNIIRAAINPEALKVARSMQCMNSRDLMYLTGGWHEGQVRHPFTARVAQDPDKIEKMKVRCQFARSYPLLTAIALNDSSDSQGKMALFDAVDRKEPLKRHIAAYLRIPEVSVRMFQGLTWQKTGRTYVYDPVNLIAVARMNPANWVTDKKSLTALKGVVEFHQTFDRKMDLLIREVKSAEQKGIANVIPTSSEMRDMADMVRDVEARYLTPLNLLVQLDACRKGEKIPVLDDDVFHLQTMHRMREASQRWHYNLRSIDNLTPIGRDLTSWSALIGRLDLGEGLHGEELTSSTDLSVTGRIKGHCVGGYTSQVTYRQGSTASLIFNIMREQEILSTLEIRLEFQDPRKSRIVQNQASHNEAPCPEAEGAAQRILAAVRNLNAEAVTAYKTATIERTNSEKTTAIFKQAGYDFLDPEALRRMHVIMNPMLPDRYRRPTVEGAMASIAASASGYLSPEEINWTGAFRDLHSVLLAAGEKTYAEIPHEWLMVEEEPEYDEAPF